VSDTELVEFEWFRSEDAAMAASASLGAAGINCVVERQDPSGAAALMRLVQGARLLVPRRDLTRAREALGVAPPRNSELSEASIADWISVPRDVIATGLGDIRKKRRIVWFFFLTYLPVGAFTVTYAPPVARYAVALWMLGFAASSVWAGFAKCPRCGNRYSRTRRWTNPWTQRCLHCELPLRTDTGRNREHG
jgi:hypothetical protein